jgi:hypothetical protein
VWLGIAGGEISGHDALLEGQYEVRGDAGLLRRMDRLFRRAEEVSVEPEPKDADRPPGPISLPGQRWMLVAFLPWLALWIGPAVAGGPSGLVLGTALALAAVITSYRIAFRSATWFETATLVVLAAALMAWPILDSWLASWFDAGTDLALGAIWLSSLVPGRLPATAEYSRWDFRPELRSNSTFLHVNGVLTHLWGWLFVLWGVFAVVSVVRPRTATALVIAHYLMLAGAIVLTAALPRWAHSLRIANPEASARRRRASAALGLAAAGTVLVATSFLGG